MRGSKLTPAEFGPFHTDQYTLQPGMVQSMQFSVSDEGPCYLFLEQRRQLRYDRVIAEMKQVELTKSELITKLKDTGKKLQRVIKSLFKQCVRTWELQQLWKGIRL